MRDSISPATQYGSPVTVAAGLEHTLPLRPEDPLVGSLEAEQQTIEGAGLSEDVSSTRVHQTNIMAGL